MIPERIKSRKKQNETGRHTNNHWKGDSTDKEGSQLEISKARYSPGLLAETISALHERMAI